MDLSQRVSSLEGSVTLALAAAARKWPPRAGT